MNLETAGEMVVDVVEKSQKFLMPMPSVAIADGDSAGHVQSREQRRNSMALVIMRLPGRHAWSQRQDRLGAVQRLHLALFIHA
jgi:hypothetical protein